MNNIKYLIILISIHVFFMSCGIGGVSEDGLIDDRERTIMDVCSGNSLTSKNEIESNLIGKWNLIGHGNSNFPESALPNINLTILVSNLIVEYKSEDIEKVDTLSWEIEEVTSLTGLKFKLTTTPQNEYAFIHHFCESYMFRETSPILDGGRMYLYEKVE